LSKTPAEHLIDVVISTLKNNPPLIASAVLHRALVARPALPLEGPDRTGLNRSAADFFSAVEAKGHHGEH